MPVGMARGAHLIRRLRKEELRVVADDPRAVAEAREAHRGVVKDVVVAVCGEEKAGRGENVRGVERREEKAREGERRREKAREGVGRRGKAWEGRAHADPSSHPRDIASMSASR